MEGKKEGENPNKKKCKTKSLRPSGGEQPKGICKSYYNQSLHLTVLKNVNPLIISANVQDEVQTNLFLFFFFFHLFKTDAVDLYCYFLFVLFIIQVLQKKKLN